MQSAVVGVFKSVVAYKRLRAGPVNIWLERASTPHTTYVSMFIPCDFIGGDLSSRLHVSATARSHREASGFSMSSQRRDIRRRVPTGVTFQMWAWSPAVSRLNNCNATLMAGVSSTHWSLLIGVRRAKARSPSKHINLSCRPTVESCGMHRSQAFISDASREGHAPVFFWWSHVLKIAAACSLLNFEIGPIAPTLVNFTVC
jgi:hypothetical protein